MKTKWMFDSHQILNTICYSSVFIQKVPHGDNEVKNIQILFSHFYQKLFLILTEKYFSCYPLCRPLPLPLAFTLFSGLFPWLARLCWLPEQLQIPLQMLWPFLPLFFWPSFPLSLFTSSLLSDIISLHFTKYFFVHLLLFKTYKCCPLTSNFCVVSLSTPLLLSPHFLPPLSLLWVKPSEA